MQDDEGIYLRLQGCYSFPNFDDMSAMGIIEDCWSDPGDFVAVRPLYGILTGSWLRRCGGSDAEKLQQTG